MQTILMFLAWSAAILVVIVVAAAVVFAIFNYVRGNK